MKIRKQETICEWQEVQPMTPESGSVVGLAVATFENYKSTIIHGLRHKPSSNSNGWYLWKGEYKEKDEFFQPICYEHLSDYISEDIIQYLDLPTGYRFLVDEPNYEDVWFDQDLLNTQYFAF
ncbi:immunity protein Imm33 domain-containing protein [Portibacter marinus]|uniref:immunity protein Imm33 domain-containing protein n=1 Tax=Portibacter marinus TaxID=2898660 RepID=UPI001F432E39|nr:hypothetical protein [Portibacter marinus]